MARTIGVYRIRCSVTGRSYVGSSVDVLGRIRTHRRRLALGKHDSRKLQNAWNKYGQYSFVCGMIEECTKATLRKRELYWINRLDTFKTGYNESTYVDKGTSLPNKLKKKLSAGARRAGKDPELRKKRSENAKKQHANGNLGRVTWSEVSKKTIGFKLSSALKKSSSKIRRKRACKICGKWGWIQHLETWYCLTHDPIPERNEQRNQARREAQRAILSSERKKIWAQRKRKLTR